MKNRPLPVASLYRTHDFSEFSFATTAELEDLDQVLGQSRALEALSLGMRMGGVGYNVFALGPSGAGRFTVVQQLVTREARTKPVPSDWCYVHNFEQPYCPRVLQMPSGRAKHLEADMTQLIEDLNSAIPAAFEGEDYRNRTESLEAELKDRQIAAIDALREEAKQQKIALVETPTGFAFAPFDNENNVISPEQYEKLDEKAQAAIESTVADLQDRLKKILRLFPLWAKEVRDKLKALNREIASFVVANLLDTLKSRYGDLPEVMEHLAALQADLLEHVELFVRDSGGPLGATEAPARTTHLRRYRINVLVDHAKDESAPVVHEDLPNHANLIGRLEYQSHMGTLVTDFTLLKPGALHHANGGYLILDAFKVLTHPLAWAGLKRSLKSREIRIESLERTLGWVTTVSLEPEPIPLDVKVILVGERLFYYLLDAYDPEFRELFKVEADFEDTMERRPENLQLYTRLLGSLARRHELRPLDREAVARVMEQSARDAGDAERLSLHMRSLTDLLSEANFVAGAAGHTTITHSDVQAAIDQQLRRAGRLRDRLYDEIQRGTVLIDTEGEAIGQVNGLSVVELGRAAFGRPSRITATASLGDGEVIDIERETELGGPIHSKGVLILSHFLGSRYAPGQPLSLHASLVFEQSYGSVEGDSASLAELCALLSVLSGLPIRQSLAVTGSVNQKGQVQPIGGVNEKIEGFFDICSARKLTGCQGVIIPRPNMRHLMLRHDVVEAAGRDEFSIYAVETVDDAMELLTGTLAGQRDAEGSFPENSVNGRVEKQLRDYAQDRQRFLRKSKPDVM